MTNLDHETGNISPSLLSLQIANEAATFFVGVVRSAAAGRIIMASPSRIEWLLDISKSEVNV